MKVSTKSKTRLLQMKISQLQLRIWARYRNLEREHVSMRIFFFVSFEKWPLRLWWSSIYFAAEKSLDRTLIWYWPTLLTTYRGHWQDEGFMYNAYLREEVKDISRALNDENETGMHACIACSVVHFVTPTRLFYTRTKNSKLFSEDHKASRNFRAR